MTPTLQLEKTDLIGGKGGTRTLDPGIMSETGRAYVVAAPRNG
jgi:hypothetical protein